jgi:alpha-L-rhamnosidase
MWKKLFILILAAGFSFPMGAFSPIEQTLLIQKAKPVWAAGREKEMNLNLGFRAVFQAGNDRDFSLKIAASSLYRVFVNGEFVGSGPARAAHGYFRVDEYSIAPYVQEGENILAVEVAGYNINSFYTIDQPSFLLSEVENGGKIILATGTGKDFEVFQIRERLQKVERYSFQRPFTEYYRMKAGYDRWRSSAKVTVEKLKTAVFPEVKLLPRNVLMPEFNILEPVSVYARGTVKRIQPEKYHKDRSLTQIGPQLKGFTEAELEVVPPSQEILEIVTDSKEIINKPLASQGTISLKANEFGIYDFGVDFSGFIGAKLNCLKPARLFFYFDEMLTDGDVKTRQRMGDICNQIVYELEPGEYALETLESYTFKFLKVIVLEGECQIENVYLREFAYPENKNAAFNSSNFKLNRIFDAAKQSSRQNAVDVFMDCASRERAGWLCDSYYAAIMEKEFTGYSAVAHNFYENYALPDSFRNIPKGMIPMCYPADFYDGNFIPNWSLWFILQVEDYARRGGDPLLIAQLKPRIEKLLDYFSGMENEDGLLEKLQGWVFVEWSKANDFVQDVNYPSNMLYSAALASAAKLYGNNLWSQKSENIRQTIIQQSFNGEFFIDNALRENGKRKRTENTTEVCQYYAFFFNIVTPASHPGLWKKLVTEFGPNRNDKSVYPKVFRANAFMGNYMRMDLLSRYGLQSQMLLEIQDYFYSMADKTGTLWEHMQNNASCNHGFASYIGHVLYRDVLGISNIDYINKEITIRFTDILLDSCSGSVPIEDEWVGLQWKRSGNLIRYGLDSPKGYKVKIENLSSAKLVILTSLQAQTQFYVSPAGNDANNGSKQAPFRTIEKAQNEARKASGEVAIILREATYRLSAPLVFTPEDGGKTANKSLTIRSYPGEKAALSGSVRLENLQWQPYKKGIWKTRISGSPVIDLLVVNGEIRHPARYPNYDPDAIRFNGTAADAIAPERVKKWKNPTGGYLHAMHRRDWGDFHYRITGKDGKGNLSMEGGWQNNRQYGIDDTNRMVENIFEELDAPGEWFYNAAESTLYYYPPEGEDVNNALFEAPQIKHLIELRGSETHPVQNITIEGIELTQTLRTFMEKYEPLLRSDWTIYRGAAVFFEGAENCVLKNCDLHNLGGNAVFFSKYNRNCEVSGSHFTRIGASAVCFAGDANAVRSPSFEYHSFVPAEKIDRTPGPKSNNYPAYCRVHDNLIHKIGLFEKQITGVELSMCRAITLSHNTIYDTPRAGINISEGTWGGHILEFNDVFNTVKETGDHGSFNSWGRDRFWYPVREIFDSLLTTNHKDLVMADAIETVIIRNNRFRCDRGWDIDLDDGSTNYHIYNNLCLNGGLKLREGFYRVVENNILINNTFYRHAWLRDNSTVFTRNIVMLPYERPAGHDTNGALIDYNIFTDSATYKVAREYGTDPHSIVSKVEFVNPASGDFRVSARSTEVFRMGFQNFDMDKFGVVSSRLKNRTEKPEMPVPVFNSDISGAEILTWEGVQIKNLETLGERSATGMDSERGVYVVAVAAYGTHLRDYLQSNDVILEFAGKPVNTLADLYKAIAGADLKKPQPMIIFRTQKENAVTVPAGIIGSNIK